MTDDELSKIVSQAVRNGTYRLYSGDLLEKAILYKKLGTVNLLLNSGYSFPNSKFDYSQLSVLTDQSYVQSVFKVIVAQYKDLPDIKFFDCFGQFLGGCIQNNNIALLRYIVDENKNLFSNLDITENRAIILGYACKFVQQQKNHQFEHIQNIVVELSKILNNQLLDSTSIYYLQQLTFRNENAINTSGLAGVCDNVNLIIGELDPRHYWQCSLALNLLKQIQFSENADLLGVANFLNIVVSHMDSNYQSAVMFNSAQIANIAPLINQILDFLLPHACLYVVQVGDRKTQEILLKHSYKYNT